MNFSVLKVLKCLKLGRIFAGILPLGLLFTALLSFSPVASAQDNTDAYDPFIDYNEFEIEDEEEADINFFRHGRFLTAGFALGQRSFTEGMADQLSDDITYGLFLSYFFDLRFALQFGWLTASHPLAVTGFSPNDSQVHSATGTVKLNGISVDLKYFLNTQNVTKGLATLNPYFIGGFTSFSRESVVDGQPEFGNDSAMAFDIGAGIEIPMMQNKMYFGAQAMYQLVNFKDENTQISLDDGNRIGKYMNGDFMTFLAVMGVNF